ncbi:MBL fold metallo-hydrolase [Natronococcus pandeyae]|uniref:MBL fold metallo-hydrolase n=1 Tax=Natronococcus pandeyae TaxID=2055836 RepID=A0A8J8Q2Z4_9EURY|nr:MBL fold metallo-hydrolase [Natronococcus pandeyae]TYL39215.1 MBL fold metallo-hydrolase [Natronococcus pandeyae]
MSTDEDPGVYVLPITVEYGGRELTINPAAVETDRGLVLIDVGPPGAVDGIRTHLREIGFGLEDIWLVLATHHDGDHVGGLAELLERIDPVVAAHHEEAPFITGEREPIKGDGDRYSPAPVDLELAGGVRIPTIAGSMTVLETPGHAPGHVSLHFSDHDLLLAGDALVADGNEPLSGPKPEFTPDMDRATESVGRLAELDVEQTLCYHGGYVEEGADRIAEIHADLRD